MNKIVYMLLSLTVILNLVQCKNDNKQTGDMSGQQGDGKSSNDPYLIPAPKGFYQPTGLKPLNIMEMFNRGVGNPAFVKSLHLKDKNGNTVPNTILDDPEKPMFVQMYVNESDSVVEAVTYELTDEIKNMVMKARMAGAKKQ